MTAVLIVSLYFLALTIFLGLDIIAKVPATLYPLVVAALGVLSAVGIVGAVRATVQEVSPASGTLGLVSAGLAAAAVGAGLASMSRLLRAFDRKKP